MFKISNFQIFLEDAVLVWVFTCDDFIMHQIAFHAPTIVKHP